MKPGQLKLSSGPKAIHYPNNLNRKAIKFLARIVFSLYEILPEPYFHRFLVISLVLTGCKKEASLIS